MAGGWDGEMTHFITRTLLKKGLVLGIGGFASLSMLTSCGVSDPLKLTKSPMAKRAEAEPVVRAYFFTTPAGFGFGAPQSEPGVAGTYSKEEGERLVASLSKRRGFRPFEATLARAPGSGGTLKMVRDFVYPTEYDVPVVDKNADGEVRLITPATPTNFATRELGVVFDYEVSRNKNGTYELQFDLKRSSFLGFVNYGDPIVSDAKGFLGRKKQIVLSENRIEMPVFDMKNLKSGVLVKEGEFLAIGGFVPATSLDHSKFEPSDGLAPESSPRPFVALIQVGQN